MSKIVQWKRGNTAATSSYTGFEGEVVINTDTWSMYVHDGVTEGGHLVVANIAAGDFTIDGNITANGNVTGSYIIGDGSQLTNVAGATLGNLVVNDQTLYGIYQSSGRALEIGDLAGNVTIFGNITAYQEGTYGNISVQQLTSAGDIIRTNANIGGLFLLPPTGNVVTSTGVFYYPTTGNPNVSRVSIHVGHGAVNFLSNSTTELIGNLVITATGRPHGDFGNAFVQVYSNTDSYSQSIHQNLSENPLASSDIVLTSNDGTDSTYFVDLGIGSNNYSFPGYGIIKPHDAYLIAVGNNIEGPGASDGANLILGSTTGTVKFFSGAPEDANLVASITPDGFIPAANVTYSLGSADFQWRDLWVANNTIYINSVPLSLTEGNVLTINGQDIVTTSANNTANIGNFVFSGNSLLNLNGGSFNNGDLSHGATASLILPVNGDTSAVQLINTYGGFDIIAGINANITGTWSFDNTGNLGLPGGGIIYGNPYTPSGSPGNTITLQPAGSGTITDQKLLVYPTAGDGDHIHLTSGNLYQTELFLGSDNLYVKLSSTGDVVVYSNDNTGNTAQWTFGTDGSTVFPTLSVPRGDTTSGNLTGTTIKIGNGSDEAIITTPDGDPAGGQSSQRLVINPGKGADNTAGEGGDIYLWAGRGGSGDFANAVSGGSGGDIKIRGGQGGGIDGAGGYIRIEAGDGGYGGGQAGYVQINAGVGQTDQQGGYVQVTSGQGVSGGDVTLTAGTGTAGPGGDVNITGGTSSNGLPEYGNVYINSGASTWIFNNTGRLIVPGEGIIRSIDDTVILQSYNTTSNLGYGLRVGTTGGLYLEQGSNPAYLTIDSNAGNAQIYSSSGLSGAAGKNLTIYAGSADESSYNTSSGGDIYLQAGQGGSNDGGGGGPGGSINITAGNSLDPAGHSGNVTINTGSNTWNFDYTGATTFPDHGAVTISGNLTVGNLYVNGNTTTINTNSYVVSDNIITMADGNPADTLDLGFVAHRTVGNVLQHTGLVRDASANTWKLFSNVVPNPGNTVDFTNAIYDEIHTGNVTAPYFIGNGSLLTGITNNYGNTNVASYLGSYGSNTIVTTGNITAGNVATSGNITFSNNNSTILFNTGAYITANAVSLSREGSIILSPAAIGTFPGIIIGGSGRLMAPNGSVHQIFNTNDVTTQVVTKLTSGTSATSTSSGALQVTGGVGITGNAYIGGNIVVTANNNITTSGTGNITGNTGGFAIGYRDIPQVVFTSNATLALTDAGKHYFSSNSANVITIPNNTTVSFNIGTAISIVQQGSANLTVTPGSGVTLYLAGNSTSASRTVGNYGMATLMKVNTDTWFINGTGVS